MFSGVLLLEDCCFCGLAATCGCDGGTAACLRLAIEPNSPVFFPPSSFLPWEGEPLGFTSDVSTFTPDCFDGPPYGLEPEPGLLVTADGLFDAIPVGLGGWDMVSAVVLPW